MDDSFSPDLGDKGKNGVWMKPELESDDTAQEEGENEEEEPKDKLRWRITCLRNLLMLVG